MWMDQVIHRLLAPGRWKKSRTSSIQHRTSNIEVKICVRCSMFDVECSMLSVFDLHCVEMQSRPATIPALSTGAPSRMRRHPEYTRERIKQLAERMRNRIYSQRIPID